MMSNINQLKLVLFVIMFEQNLFETDQEIKYRKRNQLQPSTQHRNVRDQGLSIKLFNISHVKLNDAMNVWEVEQTYHRLELIMYIF